MGEGLPACPPALCNSPHLPAWGPPLWEQMVFGQLAHGTLQWGQVWPRSQSLAGCAQGRRVACRAASVYSRALGQAGGPPPPSGTRPPARGGTQEARIHPSFLVKTKPPNTKESVGRELPLPVRAPAYDGGPCCEGAARPEHKVGLLGWGGGSFPGKQDGCPHPLFLPALLRDQLVQ